MNITITLAIIITQSNNSVGKMVLCIYMIEYEAYR